MLEIKKWFVCIVLIGMLCIAFYFLGRSHAEVRIIRQENKEIVKQVEVVKHVDKQKAQVWAKPHVGRNNLLKLMYADKL